MFNLYRRNFIVTDEDGNNRFQLDNKNKTNLADATTGKATELVGSMIGTAKGAI